MNVSKQLVNLVGLLIVVVVIAAGVALVAMPLHGQSVEIDTQTSKTHQTNSLFEQQIAYLTDASTRVDDIDGSVAELRRELAASPKLDDVHELVSSSAKAVDMRVVSVVADPPEPWAPRGAGASEAEPGSETTSADSTSEETAAPADAVPASEGAPPASGDAAPSDETAAAPNRQVLVTIVLAIDEPFATGITISTGDTSAASGEDADGESDVLDGLGEQVGSRIMTFIDKMRAGPRLITPIDVKYEFEDAEVAITVLTYFRSEAS